MGISWKKIGPLGQKWSKKNLKKRPVVFLDRDGTLIRQRVVVSKHEHMRPYVDASSLAKVSECGYLVIVITNQPPIEKGEVSLSQAKKLNETLRTNLKKRGVHVDAIYTCPHRHATGCGCKKPELGMLKVAQKNFKIDMSKSWLIGDTHTDMETGKRAKLRTILVATGSRTKDRQFFQTRGDFQVQNLRRAVAKIVTRKIPGIRVAPRGRA